MQKVDKNLLTYALICASLYYTIHILSWIGQLSAILTIVDRNLGMNL